MGKEKGVIVTAKQKVFRKCGMFPSLEDISIIKFAVEICVHSELKREILCAPGSEYDKSKEPCLYIRKQQWNQIVEGEARKIFGKLRIPEKLQKKVMCVVLPIGMRMLAWAKYHEKVIGFSCEYSINFLNSSFFTHQGIIDNKKAAEEMLKEESFNIKQKYKLSCLYCFEEHIVAFSRQMLKEHEGEFFSSAELQEQPQLIKFWCYHLMGTFDNIESKQAHEHRLGIAVESGSKAAVEYCLSKANLENALVNAAVKTIINKITSGRLDWVIFEDRSSEIQKSSWVPNEYYVDILCFLLSKMREDQQIQFFMEGFKGVTHLKVYDYIGANMSFSVLKYLLIWPYQDHFMRNARLMWRVLSRYEYSVLLQIICDKIAAIREGDIKYGEEKSYDYRGLLKEFWCQSPECYKRYILTKKRKHYSNRDMCVAAKLLSKLFTLENFTKEDEENIGLILASATDEEKENIFPSQVQKNIRFSLIEKGKWDMLDLFMLICFTSQKQIDKFKRVFIFTGGAQRVCIDFVVAGKWDTADNFMKWSALSEKTINKFKSKMICSNDGMHACVDLIQQNKGLEDVKKFIEWCFPSEKQIKAFKKKLIFDFRGIFKCANLIQVGQLELASEFINSCLSSEEAKKELKKKVAHVCEGVVFKQLITGYYFEDASDICESVTNFSGGKWEEVEKCLTWCFSSEEEMDDFKKNTLLKVSGVKILAILIKCNQWREAETFFSWLHLSTEEIKQLKKEALFDYHPVAEMFVQLLSGGRSGEGNEVSADCGSRREATELLLRWFLTDKETVLEFKTKSKSDFWCLKHDSFFFKEFDLLMEQHLRDLDGKQIAVKRKSDTLLPRKRHCNVKL